MKKLIVLIIWILFATISFAQNPTYQQRLYYSCKVWGFVKYFHSQVSDCQVDWDSVLVSTLPLIKNAVTNDDFNDALDTMLTAAGNMEIAVAPLPDTIPYDLKRNLNFGWINDPVFRLDIKEILDTIKNNFRPHPVCYVYRNDGSNPNYNGWLVFPYDSLMINSNTNTDFPDESTRLMLIFKYWNIINYFNPYNYVQDIPWDSTLYNNIQGIATATDAFDFYIAFKKIVANVNDAHAEGWTLSYEIYAPYYYYSPRLLLRYLQNNYVVVKSDIPEIAKGDVIVSVDGYTPAQREDSLRPYISAGNISGFRHSMSRYLLCGQYNTTVQIIYKDSLGNDHTWSGIRSDGYTDYWFYDYYINDSLKTVKWKKWNACNTGYVNMGKLLTSDVGSMYNNLKNTTAIIFDIRNYPNSTAWSIADLIYPNQTCFSKLSEPDVTYPGTFFWYYDSLGVNGNPTPYTGKVIILCDENTGSRAEYSCMILKAMTNSVVVGSQTAGADGNYSSFKLSQDILTGFTSLGVYYPNGDSTQRIGIVPDSVVCPTVYGIRHGRDEVLEKALDIANCNIYVPEISSGDNFVYSVYPNPASNKLNIEFNPLSVSGNVTIDVFDIQGRMILHQSISHENTGLDISYLEKGIYLLKLYFNDKTEITKIVKE